MSPCSNLRTPVSFNTRTERTNINPRNHYSQLRYRRVQTRPDQRLRRRSRPPSSRGDVPFLLGLTVGGVATRSIAAPLMTCNAGYIPIGEFMVTMQSNGTTEIYAGFNSFTVANGCLAGMGFGGYKELYIDHFVGS